MTQTTSATRHYTFNSTPLEYGVSFREPTLAELKSEKNFKYVSLEYALRNCGSYTRELIGLAPIRGNHKNILVDVKVHNLKIGDAPAVPGWHIDCVRQPDHASKDDIHHLFVTGEACRTIFLKYPLKVDLPAKYGKLGSLEFMEAPRAQFLTFSRNHLHNCQRAKHDEVRYLLRITESDVVIPHNAIRQEVYYDRSKS